MKKLKIWQIILLVLFYPVGIVYFLYWLYRTHIYKDNPKPPLNLLRITLLAVFFPIGWIVFAVWAVRTQLGTRDPSGGTFDSETAKRCKVFFAVVVAAVVFSVLIVIIVPVESGSDDVDGTSEATTTISPSETVGTPLLSITDVPTTATTVATTKSPSTTTKSPSTTTKSPSTTTKSPSATTEDPVTPSAPYTTTNTPVTTTQPIVTEPTASDAPIVIVSQWKTAHRNDIASLTIKGKPNTEYQMRVKYKSGWSGADGLGTKTSDANGYVTWDWKVGGKTTFGTWKIEITGDGQKVMSEFTVVE